MFRTGFSAALLVIGPLVFASPALAQQGRLESASSTDDLPNDFHGKISYFGNHSGEMTSPGSGEARKAGRDCDRTGKRCLTRIGGSLQVDLEFDGVVVRGSFRGSGGLRDSGLIGRRQGSQCRLFDLTDGSVWAGHCGRDSFAGTVKSVEGATNQMTLSFEAVGTKTSDYADRDRRRRDALVRARRIEFLRSVALGSAPIEDRVIASVELDSFSWTYDRLRPGTIAVKRRTKARKGNFEIEVGFDLASGDKGWARARIDRQGIACIEFWDFPGKCRGVTPPPPPVPELDDDDDSRKSSMMTLTPLTIPRITYGI